MTDVVFSHHHPDHTLNAALFINARAHDVWAAYHNYLWYDRPADGYQLSPSIRLIETPGHTPQDISTVAETAEGTVVLTHAWWSVDGPAEDPISDDHEGLRASRRKILALKPALVVPGHGEPFVPDENNPHLNPAPKTRRRDRAQLGIGLCDIPWAPVVLARARSRWPGASFSFA
ncbi:hypothetical protein [Streptomyces sp. NPDC058632]|uniref:hypothetical protein n=1 Tax=Streptomyces sp. NPDC058632 TaxID=3346567 RepID=UPI00365B305B